MKPHSAPAHGWRGNEMSAFEQYAHFWPWQQQQQHQQQPQFNAAGGPFGYRGLQSTHPPLLPPPLQQFIGWPQWATRSLQAGDRHWGSNSSQPLTPASLATKARLEEPSITEDAAVTPQAVEQVDDDSDADVCDRRLTKAESALADVLVRIFGKEAKFKKVRLPSMVNPRSRRRLELDLHSEKLSLAFERDGMQHVVYPNSFHPLGHRAAFEKQQERDRLKEQLCRNQHITLIRVPWTVSMSDMEAFVREELRRLKWRHPEQLDFSV